MTMLPIFGNGFADAEPEPYVEDCLKGRKHALTFDF